MSRVWDVWLEGDRASKRQTLAQEAEHAAFEIGEELVAEGIAAVGSDFELCVESDAGAVTRYRAKSPPAFVLEEVECCRSCGVSDDDENVQWADDTLCTKCAEADEEPSSEAEALN